MMNSSRVWVCALVIAIGLGGVMLGGLGVSAAAQGAGSLNPAAPTPAGPANWVYESDQANAQFGEAARSAGDVNGDGFADIIIGAFHYDNPSYSNSGRAFVFHGSAVGLSALPDWNPTPPSLAANGFFGSAVGSAGDVNGDGYDDVMVAMSNFTHSYANEGAVYVYYGSQNGLSQTPDWKARGDATYAHLGWDLGSAGDVNGDGYDDIIVGAFRYDRNLVSHAYVWHGSKDGLGLAGNSRPEGLPSNADWTAADPTGTWDQGNSFGTSVGTAGDVNGDGYDDVFVGAPTYDNGQTEEGMVFVWHGSNTGLGPDGTTGNADWVAEGDQAGARLSGQPLSNETCGARTAGDVNGDGYDDFLIGAYQYDNGNTDEGAAFLWLGSSLGLNGDVDGNPGNAAWQAESNLDTGWLGQELAGGDINGDGYDDVIVGSIYFDRTNPTMLLNAGAVMAWFGSGTGMGPDGNPDNADWIAFGDQANTHFAWALSSAGDVNGDHLDDILIGADLYDNPESNEGRAFVYHGQPEAIFGLSAHNDGPTTLGAATTFSATITAGTWISYSWDLGDDLVVPGRVITHTYPFPGVYTATVMAGNSASAAYASTQVTVIDPFKHIYLPAIFQAP